MGLDVLTVFGTGDTVLDLACADTEVGALLEEEAAEAS
jgi:hypothetical protein